MKICNVKEIFDNGEYITIITNSGTEIHLPRDQQHSLVVKISEPYMVNLLVSFDQGQ